MTSAGLQLEGDNKGLRADKGLLQTKLEAAETLLASKDSSSSSSIERRHPDDC